MNFLEQSDIAEQMVFHHTMESNSLKDHVNESRCFLRDFQSCWSLSLVLCPLSLLLLTDQKIDYWLKLRLYCNHPEIWFFEKWHTRNCEWFQCWESYEDLFLLQWQNFTDDYSAMASCVINIGVMKGMATNIIREKRWKIWQIRSC